MTFPLTTPPPRTIFCFVKLDTLANLARTFTTKSNLASNQDFSINIEGQIAEGNIRYRINKWLLDNNHKTVQSITKYKNLEKISNNSYLLMKENNYQLAHLQDFMFRAKVNALQTPARVFKLTRDSRTQYALKQQIIFPTPECERCKDRGEIKLASLTHLSSCPYNKEKIEEAKTKIKEIIRTNHRKRASGWNWMEITPEETGECNCKDGQRKIK
jgi:hypothetical protein